MEEFINAMGVAFVSIIITAVIIGIACLVTHIIDLTESVELQNKMIDELYFEVEALKKEDSDGTVH